MSAGPSRIAFSAAVLAGGRSSRMGRDKALVEVDGRAMASRVGDALRAAGATEVVVVGGAADARVGLGMRAVADRHPGEGPLGGLLTALGATDGAWVAVCACDLPWLDAATIAALVDAASTAVPRPDAVLARTDRPEPLCGLWHRATAGELLDAAFARGERAVHRAVDGLHVVEVAVAHRPLTNVNTPDDLTGQ